MKLAFMPICLTLLLFIFGVESRRTVSVSIDEDAQLESHHIPNGRHRKKFRGSQVDILTKEDLDLKEVESDSYNTEDPKISTTENDKVLDETIRVRPSRKFPNKKRLRGSKARARESEWYYCTDESTPKEVKLSTSNRGVMCSKEYPAHTCCLEHDLTMELNGSQIAEQVPDVHCVHFLMKLRCAHCSPRSWWLFHAPDLHRHPHKRVMPILCPAFCRKFHSACRDFVAGLQNDNFCEFHTSNEAGPCFPDYEIRRGTID